MGNCIKDVVHGSYQSNQCIWNDQTAQKFEDYEKKIEDELRSLVGKILYV